VNVDFYRTQMGHRFFEATLPDLVLQIKRVGNALEDIAETLRAETERAKQDTSKGEKTE
jgi:hypothetical protein